MSSQSQAIVQSNQPKLPKTVGFLTQKVQGLMMDGEEILAVAPQTNSGRWWIFPPDGVVITSERILFLRCNLFGFRFDDYEWRYVQDVHISSAMSGARFTATVFVSKTHSAREASAMGKRTVSMSGLVESLATKVYSIAQGRERELRDEHRVRLHQERQAERALQMPVVAQPVVAGVAAVAATPPAETPVERLSKLKSLADAGLISAEEYEGKKAGILAEM